MNNIKKDATIYKINDIFEYAKKEYGIDKWEPLKIAALFFSLGVMYGKDKKE